MSFTASVLPTRAGSAPFCRQQAAATLLNVASASVEEAACLYDSSDDENDRASFYSSSPSSPHTLSSPQLHVQTAPSSPITSPQAAAFLQLHQQQEDITMGRLREANASSAFLAEQQTPAVSFDSNASSWPIATSKNAGSWTSPSASRSTPSNTSSSITTSAASADNGSLLKEFLNEALHSSAGVGSTGSTTSRVLATSTLAVDPISAVTMMRSSSEASTSSTTCASSMGTDVLGYSSDDGDDFRFEDDVHMQDDVDDEEELEELDEDESDEDTYSRGTGHSTCPSTSSLDSFTLPRNCFPHSPSSSISSAIASSSSASSSSSSSSSRKKSIDRPFTFPAPTPIDLLRSTDLEATLRFSAAPNGSFSSSSSDEDSAPPAFFPLQRVSFAPQLRIKTQGGVPLAMAGSSAASNSNGKEREGISGMMLGVTGTVEVLDAEKSKKTGRDVIKSQRMIADFATDLTNGLRIWRRDAAPIVKEKLNVERQWRAKYDLPTEDLDDGSWDEMLAPGTFMLPLSMKIPCSDKLPPSFESAHFRIRYVMSLALFGSRRGPDGKPEVLHVHTIPFTILPSTLPTPPPQIPMLTHDSRKNSFFAGISRALSLSGATGASASASKLSDKSCTHIICPSLPTTSYSPGSVIPITLRIADCPAEPTDLYIRLSLIRKVYVRDAAYPMMNEWGLPDDLFFEEFCKEEEEIVSRWGYVPYSVRAQEGATPGSKAQVIISDITLPVGGDANGGAWNHGYSCSLDLAPTSMPSMKHGECSWFSPALARRPPAKAEYERYIHASTRHFVSIEIGFANDRLGDVLAQVGNCVNDMEVPAPNTFTYPSAPSMSSVTGLPTSNPFPSLRSKKAAGSFFQTASQMPAFPGKMKEILIPVTIGSVAEPQMSCLLNSNGEPAASVIPPAPRAPSRAATAEESADRAARDADESETERHERVGDDGEEPWMFPPPSYAAALSTVPAYA